MRRSEGRKRRGKRDRSSFGRAVSPAAAGARGKRAATGTQIARQRRSGLPRKGARMKLLIASDLHGSAYYCEKLLEAFQREEADRILFLGDILLHEHTHVPAWTPFGDHNLYLNPGSLSLPKQNSPHSYMTLEDGVFVYKDLSGGVYHEVRI